MKKLTIILALLISVLTINASAQKVDSTKQNTEDIQQIKNNLHQCHKQYKGGFHQVLIGTAVELAGVGLILAAAEPAVLIVSGIGTIISTVGGIRMLDSHKWLDIDKHKFTPVTTEEKAQLKKNRKNNWVAFTMLGVFGIAIGAALQYDAAN